jgi:hypothetical protein
MYMLRCSIAMPSISVRYLYYFIYANVSHITSLVFSGLIYLNK